jgi:hypothetical protein
MARTLILALASTAAVLTAGTAHAGGVTWTIGINAPGVTTVVSSGPVYHRAPVYVPAPVVYAPAPTYLPPPAAFGPPQVSYPVPHGVYGPVPRHVVQAPVVVVRPVPVVYERVPQWAPPGHRHEGRRDWRRDDRRHGHDARSDWRADRRDDRRGHDD